MWSQESVLQSKTRLSFFSKKIKLALEFNVRRLCDCEILIWIDFSKNKKKIQSRDHICRKHDRSTTLAPSCVLLNRLARNRRVLS